MEEDMEMIESLEVIPMIEDKPAPYGKIVGEGDLLSVISLKSIGDDDDADRVVKRNSFRDLHHPNISHLSWVMNSDSKEEVSATNSFVAC